MITLGLTGKERLQFQYILPVQGSIKTLELSEDIFEKINIDVVKNIDDIEDIDFEPYEIEFICNMIHILDKQSKLNLQSLSLIKKILNVKE